MTNMNKLYEWFQDDITWCGNECWNTACDRNVANRIRKEGIYSMALFKGTEMCPLTENKLEGILKPLRNYIDKCIKEGIPATEAYNRATEYITTILNKAQNECADEFIALVYKLLQSNQENKEDKKR